MKTFVALSISESLNLHPKSEIWKIKSIHHEYLNLLTPNGLVTLVKAGKPMIPFGIEVDLKEDWFSYGISENQVVYQFPDQIVFEGICAITDYQRCPHVSCQPIFDRHFNAQEQIRRLHFLYQNVLKTAQTGGILTYLGMDDLTDSKQEGSQMSRYLEKVRARYKTLVTGIRSDSDERIREGVCGLLGIGQGLTPSGDDFLLGFLCGLREVGVNHSRSAAEKMAHCLAENAPSRTTTLSVEYLTYGIKRLYHQNLKELIEAFNMGNDEELSQKAVTLIGLGHFSGTDLLTGFIMGAQTTLSITPYELSTLSIQENIKAGR